MRVVRLNGDLGKKYGRIHKLDVSTPAEAVRALIANYPSFHQDLASSHERGVAYKCVVDRELANEEILTYPMSRSFSITPVVSGAGKIGSIILGVAILGIALAATGGLAGIGISGFGGGFGLSATMATSIGFAGLTYGSVAFLGAALILGGVAQMLAPTPKAGSRAETKENPYFNGAENTTQQGVPVPIGYGRAIVGSALISANITVEQQSQFGYGYDYYYGGYNLP